MRRNKKILIYSILSLSVLFNIVTLSLDTYPFIYPIIKEKFFPEKTLTVIDENTCNLILNRSIEMAESPKVEMVWNEPMGVTSSLIAMRSTRLSNEFQTYNFPRAFLIYGISEYLIKKQNDDKLNHLKIIFDKFLDKNGVPSFTINRIDQVPFGLTAINLYKEFGEKKYLKFADRLYEYIVRSIEEEGVVSYREGQSIIYEDMLGMVVPFLLEYHWEKEDESSLKIAKDQMSYYINYGVDKETYLPTHAINRKEKIKIGPTNWGRGVGWYYIALANFYKQTGEFKEEYEGLQNTLLSLRNSNNLWSQFPGGMDKFDASASTMIAYSILLYDNSFYKKEELLGYLKPYISIDGEILQTSGDTYGLNNYSHTFGKSELSQGMLLLALSQFED